MTALTQDLSIDSKIAHVDVELKAGKAYTIGDEIIRAGYALVQTWDDVAGASSGLRWFITRGEDHTTAAAHSSGATLTLARKYGEGGAGEQTVYVQPTDPGAVGAGKLWVDTTADPPFVRRRSEADDGWTDLLEDYLAVGAIQIASAPMEQLVLLGGNAGVGGIGGTAQFIGGSGDDGANPGAEISAGGGTDADPGRLNVITNGSTGNAGEVLVRSGSGGLVYGDLADIASALPEVPASPTEQDIVDALLALGLVTQAAP